MDQTKGKKPQTAAGKPELQNSRPAFYAKSMEISTVVMVMLLFVFLLAEVMTGKSFNAAFYALLLSPALVMSWLRWRNAPGTLTLAAAVLGTAAVGLLCFAYFYRLFH